MKKLLIFAAIFVFLVIIGVSVFILLEFSSGETDVAQSSNIEQYAKEYYPIYSAKYDENSKILTLEKTTEFSFESAQSIYSDSSTYLTQVQIIALDIASACNESELTVVLCYLSKDGKPMFSVANNGVVTRYWQSAKSAT